MEVTNKLKALVDRVEAGIDRHVPPADTRPARLHAAMRYSMQAGGKRLRPCLLLAVAELESAPGRPDPLPAAVALECLHTYSLIHDDLPCMDDDDLRRGRPTVHRQFDEPTALLAGDALLTHAFALLAEAYAEHPQLAHQLIRELGRTAGSERLIGGQMEDLLGEAKIDATPEDLDYIHLNKTAAMIETSLVMGGMIAGWPPDRLDELRAAGQDLGLAFQVVDDILDVTADTATLGKTAGKDAATAKTTYVRLHGVKKSREIVQQRTERARATFAQLPGDTSFLHGLATAMAERAN